jgi:hypothetical protein
MTEQKEERLRALWLTFYGIFVALLVQVFYNFFGFLGLIPQTLIFLTVAVVGIILLWLFAFNGFSWRKTSQALLTKENFNSKTETVNETDAQKISRLITHIDNENKLFRNCDVLGRSKFSFLIIIAAIYLFSELALIYSSTTLTEKVLIFLSEIAVIIALISIVSHYARNNIINSVYERMKVIAEERDRPLLKALLKIKYANREFTLAQLYDLHPEIFAVKNLMDILVRETGSS